MKTFGSYVKRVRALGWPFLLTGLAFVLGIVALAQPIWMYDQTVAGGDVDRWTYGWSVVTHEQWQNGAWSGTTVTPYTSPSFADFRVRDAVGTSYGVASAYVASLFVLGLLQFLARPRKIPQTVMLIVTLASLALGITAVLYPAVAIGSAANLDLDTAISGFVGSAAVNGPGSNDYTLTWGAAAGWWLWMAATLLTGVVFAVPLLQRKPWARASPAH